MRAQIIIFYRLVNLSSKILIDYVTQMGLQCHIKLDPKVVLTCMFSLLGVKFQNKTEDCFTSLN